MTPEERKRASENLLQERGIAINPHLPVIESEKETALRTPEELLRRLIALWAVAGTAFLKDSEHFRDYVFRNELQSWLSDRERKFILDESPSENEVRQNTWRLECLYFLAWCAGLIDAIDFPSGESSIESITHLFPREFEPPEKIRQAMRVRGKDEILDWGDLLYRLHWAGRHAIHNGGPEPPDVSMGVVQEWHLAVNWMMRHDGEDEWDHVTTDT